MPIYVPLAGGIPPVSANFIVRRTQFTVEARLNERLILAHIADWGGLDELLLPGAQLLLASRQATRRKTALQVTAIAVGDALVSLDPGLPNQLIAAALADGLLPQFARCSRIQPEAQVGNYRFDFRLGEGLATCLVEVESTVQIGTGVRLFPDVPTGHGQQQVALLTTLARNGQRTALIFVVQGSSGKAFAPGNQGDLGFGRALRRAIATGVEVYAYRCPVTPEGISLGEPLPIFGAAHDL
jgi:sugar fermentation stimulation protein A